MQKVFLFLVSLIILSGCATPPLEEVAEMPIIVEEMIEMPIVVEETTLVQDILNIVAQRMTMGKMAGISIRMQLVVAENKNGQVVLQFGLQKFVKEQETEEKQEELIQQQNMVQQ